MLKNILRFYRDENGAVTVEWVVLTAGVIALGIAGYGAFKIDMDSSTISVAHHSSGGTLPKVSGGNAMTRLMKTVELEMKMFRACNFKSADAQFSAGSNSAACRFRETGPNAPEPVPGGLPGPPGQVPYQ